MWSNYGVYHLNFVVVWDEFQIAVIDWLLGMFVWWFYPFHLFNLFILFSHRVDLLSDSFKFSRKQFQNMGIWIHHASQHRNFYVHISSQRISWMINYSVVAIVTNKALDNYFVEAIG